MKKIFTLFVAVLVAATSFAQVSFQSTTGKMNPNNRKGIERNVKSAEEGWISTGAYLESYWGEGTVQSGSGNYLWIDSLGLVKFGDNYSHPWFFSVSQSFDFASDFWDMASLDGELSLTNTSAFNIDSISITGFYFRGERIPAGTKDTLIVGITTNLDRESDVYHFTNYENSCFFALDYDAQNGVPAGAQIYKFPIDENNVSEPVPDQEGYYYFADLDFPINLNNITGKGWNIAYTFKRGYQVGMNDTLDYYSYGEFFTWASPDANYSISANNPDICDNLSHGQFNNVFTNGGIDYYYPGWAYSSPFHYPKMYVKIACTDCAYVGVEEMEKENITVYPNPATSNFTVKLNGEENAHIQLFNLVGQQVYSETAANSTTINVSNLKAGIYMLKVTQNGKVYTSKVVVK